MNIRFVIRTFLNLQRLEAFLAVLLPFFLIIESAAANAWAYAGGSFDWHDPRTYIAIGRGLFFEVLTYSAAKLCKMLILRRRYVGSVITGLVALWCIVVSAGNNLAWVLGGGELGGMLASVSHFLPPYIGTVYQMGLGLLLPLAVGALALVDIQHLVEETLHTAHLDNKAVQVHEAEMHRTEYLKSQESQRKTIKEAYDEIAGRRTQAFIDRVGKGDMSFGANDLASGLPAASGARRLNAPAANGVPGLPMGNAAAGGRPMNAAAFPPAMGPGQGHGYPQASPQPQPTVIYPLKP